ncbi:MBL fold metallo-hydrolase [Parabacteroides sp. 52]|uniref:MBL fold metallo-hydrolase n=1 Tax=unclassified Parabacteroides TaxID=2649774 RepID=UPI0013D7ED61|nr:MULTISPECIES: MBL fold metallo-hydrolase [unclassified Parabacteroides]MDH6534057.1 hydroxyacylglutathione hydrolase [Parabacteroides sp. PM5-20]NDV54798.1 MBL fold metallo-hydrolase [Parabacteroides sp. 52]
MITIKSFNVNFFSENTYILYDDTLEAVIIDCGCIQPEEEMEIKEYIEQNKLVLKHNLCTHLHLDHILGNAFIYNTYGLHPEAHKADEENLPCLEAQARLFGLPIEIKNIPIEKYIIGGEPIYFGHSELTAILVPGHSPGSLAFYNKKNGYLFSGDALFANSIGRTDLWGGNQEVLVTAIKEKLLTLPEETIVYPGHGPETTVFAEKMNNPFL